MKTFYDFRNADFKNPEEFPVKGILLFKWNKKWMLWVKNVGVIVAPKSIYLYDWYMPKNIIDAFKFLFTK